MKTYSPFEKNIIDLEAIDLVTLKDVAEGWYVEYKSETSSATPIAKSISAFANTYGGIVREKFLILEVVMEPLGSIRKNIGKSTAAKYEVGVRAKYSILL